MAINDFITSTLNLGIDQIDSLDIVRKDDVLHIHVKLKDAHPKCPYCGGDTKRKGYTHHTNNHLKMGGRKMGHNLLILVPFDFCAN